MRCFKCLSSSPIALFLCSAIFLTSAASCRYTVSPTTVHVTDPVRHYFPVIVTEEVRMSYELTNTGENPLIITDVLPSCSAVTLVSQKPEIVPPGQTERLNFIFVADKNIGYVQHDIRIYGNIDSTGIVKLTFDTHVVRPTPDRSDYEEIFWSEQSKKKELVDGKMWEKGYWTDNGTYDF